MERKYGICGWGERSLQPSPCMTPVYSELWYIFQSLISAREQDLCVGPLRRHLVSTRPCLSLMDKIPTDFHSQLLCGNLCLLLMLQDGEPSMGFRPLTLQKVPLQLRYPCRISTLTLGCRANPYCISVLPTSLDVASSVIPG